MFALSQPANLQKTWVENAAMRISLGPIQYYWPAEQIKSFYDQLRGKVELIYLGETVCGRRREMGPAEWVGLGKELAEEGHEVVLSALGLVEARSEAAQVKRLCENGDFMVEANDFTAISFLEANKTPFVAGPSLNIYSGRALREMQKLGARRWVPPVELPGQGLRQVLSEFAELSEDPMETEVYAYGRMPLAFSARCFTARHYGLGKDDCDFVCKNHPEGLGVVTRAGESFLTINGIQAQSFGCLNLLPALTDMKQMGVSAVRLSPRPVDMTEVVEAFRAGINGEDVQLTEPDPGMQCDGYWWGQPGCGSRAVENYQAET
ncbi:Putative protease [Halorhodospira halochloris]|uniref:Ubiquinone biosynthesis protein UbiV n=2 Tax=Halorhodospira halochloris TaxID=1052 RepID=A0A0X8X6G3_HALHR|nr:Putative protease [Halorhodospira halochloris]